VGSSTWGVGSGVTDSQYYELTEIGSAALAAEARRLARRSREALRRLNLAPRPA
jgi:hypothetical protein